ncbi:MAG: DUF3944 domain-containing protein [Muribaculaceae bacterium]|nr:DUF3944 domain-containing protein [Muribaculaceae bacterium]
MKVLQFLTQASNDDLRLLCDIVVKNKSGEFRATESLSSTQKFLDNYPYNIKAFLPELVEEFRLFGGNSIANFFRGEGPEYYEILRDVARKNNVEYTSDDSNQTVEKKLLQKLFMDTINNASDEDLIKMMKELGLPTTNFSRETATAALLLAWKAGGFQSYILLVSVVNAVMKFLIGRGLSIAGNAALTRMASIVMGPIGWVLTALWTIIDIAGPAFRVTVPAVIQIAYIRQSLNTKLLK